MTNWILNTAGLFFTTVGALLIFLYLWKAPRFAEEWLSPEGKLVTCLFAATGRDLKTPLRAGASDDDLRALVAGTWGTRRDRYSEERAEVLAAEGEARPGRSKIEMFRIGG